VRNLFIFLCIISLSGCAGSPAQLGMMSPEELNQQPSLVLCNAYHVLGSDKVKEELLKRGEITDDEWSLIEGEQYRIGMSELSLICSLGKPNYKGAINKSAGSWGTKKQYVYPSIYSSKRTYIYVRNGIVTSYQN